MDSEALFLNIRTVSSSWDRVKAIPNYEDVAGVLLFKRIFEIAPSAFTLFSFSLGYTLESDQLYESETFKQHAKKVVRMVDAAINMLGPDLEIVSEQLLSLGASHAGFGVLPVHYPIVGEALLDTLKVALGNYFTLEVKQGWEGLYGFVSQTMIQGAKEALKGDCKSTDLQDSTETVESSSRIPQHEEIQQEIYYHVVEDVSKTWDRVKKIPDYDKIAGTLLFKKIFEIAPGAEKMFQFSDGHEPGSEEMYNSESFLQHAKIVVNMLDAAINLLGPDLEIVTEILLDLGAKHVRFGVEPVHYPIVGEALLWTLEQALGKAWNATIKKGWTEIYGFVSATMIRGATDSSLREF